MLWKIILQYKPVVLFVHETKRTRTLLETLLKTIWKGSQVIAVEIVRALGGLVISLNPLEITLSSQIKERYKHEEILWKLLGLESYLVPIWFFLKFSFLFTSILFYFKLNSFDFLSIFYVMNVILFYFTSIHSALIKSFISLKKIFKILISIFFNSYVVI